MGGIDIGRSMQLDCGFGLEDWTVVSAIDSFDMFEVSLVGVICAAIKA